MTQLYKLTEEYHNALCQIAEMQESGEIDEVSATDTIEGLSGEVEAKAINVALHIKNLRSDLAQVDAVVKEYQQRAKSIKSSIEFFESYLDTNMQKTGIQELKNEYVAVKYKNLPAIVEVTADTPDEFTRVIPEKREPDKVAIGKALKDGAELPFAHLVTGRTKLEIK